MGRPEEPSYTPSELRVDLPELRGYAALLDDTTRDLRGCGALADQYCVDAEFGKIVEDLADDYATLLPQLKELLDENAAVMRQYAVAVDRTTADFERTDDGVASRFEGDGIDARNGTARYPGHAVGSARPSPSEGDLPEVSFGFLFDKLAWALEKFCGWDVRAAVTDKIAGDTVAMSTQAECWEIIGTRLGKVNDGLRSGGNRVGRTWSGYAADAHDLGMVQWDIALSSQSSGLKDLGESLRALAKEAVNVAQLVVDCIRLAVDLIASAWALQYIPVVGQVKFVKKCWDAYKRAQKAVAYIKMIISAVRATKSLVVVLIDSLTPTMVPGKPLSV